MTQGDIYPKGGGVTRYNVIGYAGAEEIIRYTGATGLLEQEIRRRYASRSRGGAVVPAEGIEYLRDWAILCGLVEPRLEWLEERHGTHVLVRPVVVGAHGAGHMVHPLRDAIRVLEQTVERAWGTDARRYHDQPGGRRRLRRDQEPVVRAWDIVLPIWASLAADAIATAIEEPYWYITYRWAQPRRPGIARGAKVGKDPIYPEGVDPQMPHISGRPASPAARREQLRALAQVRADVERIRPRLLALTPQDLSSHHNANRAGYLPRLAGVEDGLSAGVYAAIEADAEIAQHCRRLRDAKFAEFMSREEPEARGSGH